MVRASRFVLAGLLLIGPAAAAVEPKAAIRGPRSAYVDWPITLRFQGTVGDRPATVHLASGPEAEENVDFLIFTNKKGFPTHAMMVPGKPGMYRFAVVSMGKPEGEEAEKIAIGTADVWVIDPLHPQPYPPAPTPTPPDPGPGPVPPGPQPTPPTPTPPDPTPTPPEPAPDPDAGIVRALLLYESSSPMSRKQEALWYAPETTDLLNSATTADTNQRGGWRRWDKDIKLVKEAPEWQGMLDAARGMLAGAGAPPLPVIVVFRGKKGLAHKFPEDLATLQSILKR